MAHKMEDVQGFGDYAEKAETGAIGRALALCGYGTQFAPELEEGAERIVGPVDFGKHSEGGFEAPEANPFADDMAIV